MLEQQGVGGQAAHCRERTEGARGKGRGTLLGPQRPSSPPRDPSLSAPVLFRLY